MGNVASNQNVLFYQNKLAPEPFKLTIGEIIEFWSGNYERLNENEYYIHWLFPNKDRGRNKYAYAITNAEIEVIKNDPVLIHRFMAAFDMMLDFFGMERKNIQFLIASESRLSDMNKYTKSYMKISRILKSLRLFGLEGIWENWLNFLLELIDSGKLHNARACYNEFWIKT